MQRRVLVTGCSGYLAANLIQALRNDPGVEWIGGIDVREPKDREGWHFFALDVRSPELASLLQQYRVDTVAHLAWVFNPTHNPELEHEVDVSGSRNVLDAVVTAHVPYVLYLSSTTSYGPHPDNPLIFDESYPRRGHAGYLYAKYKAEVDHIMLEFMREHPEVRLFLIRACIVLGPNTRNIVTRMTEMPIVFGVLGYDPPMQFIHEEDVQRLLAWAVKEQPVGVYNVAGHNTISFSKLIRCLKKKGGWLPSWLLYPALGLLWKLRLMPFPPSILDFIRYPWVADSQKFYSAFPFPIQYSSEEALMAYAHARWPEKFLG